ncbi:hypothetical protein [Halorientalis regularis]|jgi:hypothetical protein|uniref:DUF1761 domain-containing protein n=1 Tax=Halorientalis regularis TaxID=660518 RepID=A0A1G7R772_9EURY|nr:hypothetical protein [Halorientalis regularis]SDG06598.1 hypothetical protein SAMN05216218_11483 [Halorientalis regularis]
MADPTILGGLAGGLIATIVMTVFMLALGDDSPPPTAALWSKYVGDGPPAEYMPQGMALHMLYGIGAGAAFAVAFPFLGVSLTLATGVGLGFVYGIVLTVVGMVLWMRIVLAMEPEPKTMGLFFFFHLVYGGVLGAWLSLGLV